MKLLNLIVIMVCLVGCQAFKKTSEESALDKVLSEHFEAHATTAENTTGTFIIISQANKPSMRVPVNALKFGIYDVQKKALVYTEQKYNAKAEWYNDEYVVVKSRPGMQSTDEKINSSMGTYYIHVKTLEKLTQLPN